MFSFVKMELNDKFTNIDKLTQNDELKENYKTVKSLIEYEKKSNDNFNNTNKHNFNNKIIMNTNNNLGLKQIVAVPMQYSQLCNVQTKLNNQHQPDKYT